MCTTDPHRVQPKSDDLNSHGFLPQAEMEALVEKYQHPILKEIW